MSDTPFFRIYGFTGCQWCARAKSLLTIERIPYQYIDLGPREAAIEWLDQRGITAPNRTFPRVYRRNSEGEWVMIGGFTELKAYIEPKLI